MWVGAEYDAMAGVCTQDSRAVAKLQAALELSVVTTVVTRYSVSMPHCKCGELANSDASPSVATPCD